MRTGGAGEAAGSGCQDGRTSDELDDVLAAPTRLLTADRAAIRDRVAADESVECAAREVFLQAEAIFGEADVPPAEFASWLHFAAKATGQEEYAERVTAAGPDAERVAGAGPVPEAPSGHAWSWFYAGVTSDVFRFAMKTPGGAGM
ncbi:hypothetical protein [Streptomyces sp. V3I7]|uniref:hypothetical protein n=1 Tax=Streptomyces sp. V3I7 TaxID=3042278 RepID=UPI0027863B59|nr:hypothetical protein [Streptomyces sp. V3I7]MDQ0991656.1 hypothetical protein [Streptomyces sp. V3I7]